MSAKKDYYDVLGVDKNADSKTIKRAFLKKARALHPDVNKAPDAEEQFKEVNEAYTVLSDDTKRANYDRYGSAEGPNGFGSDYVDMSDIFSGFGMDDIFSSIFGGGHGQSATQARTRGRDMSVTLHISLEEAARGVTKTIAYERMAPCDDCNGTGVAKGGKVETCPHCHGTGRVTTVQRTILGAMQSTTTCPECHGTGKIVTKPCETCEGTGRTPSHESVKVTIQPGIHSGQTLTIPDKGEAGVRGDTTGNLLVQIQIDQHERFERRGDDLYMALEVTALEALVGAQKTVKGILPDEQVRIDIPRGTQYGDQIKVSHFGMPRMNSKARGSLIAVVRIKVETDLTEEERKTLADILVTRTKKTSKAQAKTEKKQSKTTKTKRRTAKHPFTRK